jgi:hypothetical protein
VATPQFFPLKLLSNENCGGGGGVKIGINRKPPLLSVNFCDFLTPTDAVTENPRRYLYAEKYY